MLTFRLLNIEEPTMIPDIDKGKVLSLAAEIHAFKLAITIKLSSKEQYFNFKKK
ncbi:hypothetical protein GCM10009430_23440 [Aquimarina litoralis]|uniref:Uncharacterized protein n=1 Tax=Aquimarina litoralis TaxID=584605 RepID=A0ABN1IUR0_9FLAO